MRDWTEEAWVIITHSNYGWASQVMQCLKKNLPAMQEMQETGSIPGLGRSPGVRNGSPLQYSWLKNSINRGAWWCPVHEVAKSRTQLSMHTCTLNSLCCCFEPLSFKVTSYATIDNYYILFLGKPSKYCISATPPVITKLRSIVQESEYPGPSEPNWELQTPQCKHSERQTILLPEGI